MRAISPPTCSAIRLSSATIRPGAPCTIVPTKHQQAVATATKWSSSSFLREYPIPLTSPTLAADQAIVLSPSSAMEFGTKTHVRMHWVRQLQTQRHRYARMECVRWAPNRATRRRNYRGFTVRAPFSTVLTSARRPRIGTPRRLRGNAVVGNLPRSGKVMTLSVRQQIGTIVAERRCSIGIHSTPAPRV